MAQEEEEEGERERGREREAGRQTETEDNTLLHKDKDLSTNRIIIFTYLSLITNTAILNTSKKNTNK